MVGIFLQIYLQSQEKWSRLIQNDVGNKVKTADSR